jgi:hypothetical protein
MVSALSYAMLSNKHYLFVLINVSRSRVNRWKEPQ